MTKAENIEKRIEEINFKSTPAMRSRILAEATQAMKQTINAQAEKPSVRRIIMRSRITKFAAAAAMMGIAVLIGISFFNGTNAWAKVIQAFNEVENVHISATMTGSYKAEEVIEQSQWYLRKPDHIYEDSRNRIIIDNGTDRLTLDKEKKTAQFSDSFMPYRPLKEHHMLEMTGLFRGENTKGYEFKELVDECDETTLVFSLKYKEIFKGKAWVNVQTMLPLKIQAARIEEIKDIDFENYEIVFSYEPIPDKTFAMEIPEGFTELVRKQRGVFSGKVLDESGQGVNGAVVYVVDMWGKFAEKGQTNKKGFFSFVLPPEGVSKHVYMPVFLRAFCEDDPNRVAWTTINNPAVDRDMGAEIPGEMGEIEFEVNMLKNATGIVISMEPAGRIFGTVMNTVGEPLSNISIMLRCDPLVKWRDASTHLAINNLGSSAKRGELVVQTDTQGHYEFRNLPRFGHNSSFTLFANSSGYVRTSARFRAKTPLKTEKVDIKMFEAGLTVTGRLIDNYDQPLSAIDIWASATIDDCHASVGTHTDEKGKFRIEGAPVSQDLKIEANLKHKNNISPHEEKEKYNNYVYYPNVVVEIECQDVKTEYEVEMIAERPELVLNVEVRNTAGEMLPYFPVEIRGDAGTISTQWEVDKKFKRRTNETGRCTFTEVPNVKGLKLVLHGANSVWHEKLSEDVKKIVDQHKKDYFWSEVPVEIIDGQKEYNITAVALTSDEYENQKNSHK